MRKILAVILIVAAGYIGFQKFVRNPEIEAGNLEEVMIYDDYGEKNKVTFLVEIADDPFERQKGLMYREKLLKDHGMLFVFKRSGNYSMWMKNTSIPLDMIFINSSHQVVELIENATPNTEIEYGGTELSSFVLEVNAGSIKKYGINVGNVVKGLSKGR